MNPESNGCAPGGSETSDEFNAIVGSPSTECSVLALLSHLTVCPALIVTLSGRNFGGLSLILMTIAGVLAPNVDSGIENSAKAIITIETVKQRTRDNLSESICAFVRIP